MAKQQLREATKPPEEEFTEEQMAANRARLRELLGGLAGRNGTHHYNKPERISEIMARKPRAKPVPKAQPHTQPNTVVNEEPLHTQPHTQPNRVVQSQKNIGLHMVLSIYENISKHRFSFVRLTIDEVDMRCAAIMCEVGVKRARFIDACQTMPIHLRLSEVCEQLAGEVAGF